MQIGDLVRNLNSESGLLGIIVGWSKTDWRDDSGCKHHPVVQWADGRRQWIMAHRVKVISASR